MSRLKELLEQEAERNIKELGSCDAVATVDDTNSLVDEIIELEKIDLEKEKIKVDRRDKLIKHILTGATFVATAAITIWGTIYSDKFDEEKIRDKEAGKVHIRNLLNFMKK